MDYHRRAVTSLTGKGKAHDHEESAQETWSSYFQSAYLCSKSTGAVTSCMRKILSQRRILPRRRWSQVLWLQPGVFRDLLQSHRASLLAVMPRPGVVGKSVSLKLHVGSLLLRSRFPADTEQGPVDADCFTARPRVHKKRMDFGDLRICSVRSAMTRRARAVTFTSASCSVVPYAITPGSSGTSASHRPSVSRSKTMLKDSPSGGWGTVAMEPPAAFGEIRSPQRLFVAQALKSSLLGR